MNAQMRQDDITWDVSLGGEGVRDLSTELPPVLRGQDGLEESEIRELSVVFQKSDDKYPPRRINLCQM